MKSEKVNPFVTELLFWEVEEGEGRGMGSLEVHGCEKEKKGVEGKVRHLRAMGERGRDGPSEGQRS